VFCTKWALFSNPLTYLHPLSVTYILLAVWYEGLELIEALVDSITPLLLNGFMRIQVVLQSRSTCTDKVCCSIAVVFKGHI